MTGDHGNCPADDCGEPVLRLHGPITLEVTNASGVVTARQQWDVGECGGGHYSVRRRRGDVLGPWEPRLRI